MTPTVSIDGWPRRPDGKLRFRAVCTHPIDTYTVRARFDIDDDADGQSNRSVEWRRTVKLTTGATRNVTFDDYGRLDVLPFGTDAPRKGVYPIGERHQAFLASVDTIWAECRDLDYAEFRQDDMFFWAGAVLAAHGRYPATREWYDRVLTRSNLGADVVLDIQSRYVATFESEGDGAAAKAARERFEPAVVGVRPRVQALPADFDAEEGENVGPTIVQVLRSDPALRRCRDIAASRNPALTGRTTLAFTVREGGVRDARVVSDTTGDTGWQECARKALSAARFPDETSAEVSEFPFVFEGPRIVSDQPSLERAP